MMLLFQNPIPVVVDNDKEAYAIYTTDGGMFENDCWTCVLCDSGIVRHYTTDKIKIHHNATYGLVKNNTDNK